MVCHIDNRFGIAFYRIVQMQGIFRIQRESYLCRHIAGVAVGTVRALEGHNEGVAVHFGSPQIVAELAATVEAGAAVIDGELIGLAIQTELRLFQTVCKAAHSCTDVIVAGQIAFQIVIAQHHIANHTVLIRHQHRHQVCTVCADRDRHTVFIIQGIQLYSAAVRHRAPFFFCNHREILLSCFSFILTEICRKVNANFLPKDVNIHNLCFTFLVIMLRFLRSFLEISPLRNEKHCAKIHL